MATLVQSLRTAKICVHPGLYVTSLWLFAALALTACGGGSGPSPGPSAPPATGVPSTPPAQGKGTVLIQVTTTDGVPVPGLSLAINGGFDSRGAQTDAHGEARFTEVPAGDASINTGGGGYHSARSRFTVVGDALTTVPIVVESVTEAIPVVLGARTSPSQDGSTMILELDIAVLGEQGTARETLTSVDFQLDGDCGWNWCLVNADGTLSNFYYSARVEGADLVPLSAWARPPLATAFLLDQSENMAAFDPAGLRVSGLDSFLGSITAPDSITLGSYYDSAATGEASRPIVTTNGPFTSDTSDLTATLAALPGQEIGRNTAAAVTEAVAQLVQLSSSTAAGAPSGARRSVVVVESTLSAGEGFPVCPSLASCAEAVRAARTAGISVVAIGTDISYGYWLASSRGGTSVQVVAAEQLRPVFRGLDSIISGNLAFNRVRLALDSVPGGLQPGRHLGGYLLIRIGPNTVLQPYITVPIREG